MTDENRVMTDGLICPRSQVSRDIKDLLDAGGVLPLRVTGYSMMPFLHDGEDVVFISKQPLKALKQGQILLYEKNGVLVLHRVLRVYPNGTVRMNGDAQAWTERIYATQILGTVLWVERRGKRMFPDGGKARLCRCLWRPTRWLRPILMRVFFPIRNRKQ